MKKSSTTGLLNAVWRAIDVASGVRIVSLFRFMKLASQSTPKTMQKNVLIRGMALVLYGGKLYPFFLTETKMELPISERDYDILVFSSSITQCLIIQVTQIRMF